VAFAVPFTVSGLQSLGMAQFLADYFESHTDTSVGKFYTDKITFSALPLHEAVALLNQGVPLPVPPKPSRTTSLTATGKRQHQPQVLAPQNAENRRDGIGRRHLPPQSA
jgi:hypothetical protein